MQQIVTAKLKLETTTEQLVLLRQTQLAYRDALNFVKGDAFEHGKVSSAKRLHIGTYRDIRSLFNLPSQMACSVMRQVGTTYKGLWMKLSKNIEHSRSGYTKRRFKGLDKPPRYISPTLTYVNGRDYGFKPDQSVSVLTLFGRINLPYQGYSKHVALIHHGATLGEAKLWYDKRHRQYYLLVSLKLEMADPTQEIQRTVIGVDVGQRYVAVTSTMTEESQFYAGREVRAEADHYARLQCQNKACPYRLRVGHAYTLHADLIGARNIAMRTLLIRQDWVRTGALPVRPGSDDPNVSDREAKAARLSRYAELRWSSDASSSP